MEKMEEKMAEALKNGNGRIEFNNEEMQAIIEEAKRKGFDKKIDIKV